MTRETKHTPGNWHAHNGQIYPEETGQTIATVHYFDKTNEEHQANQRLIAAAPDLLAALELVVTICEVESIKTLYGQNPEHWTNVVLSAIQKATQP